MPRTRVTLAPLGLDTVEGWRKANEEEEAADGCFTWSGQVRVEDERVQERLTKCLDDELLADLVDPVPAKAAPVTFQPGTVSIVLCRWKLDRELKVALGLWSWLPTEIRSE